jgi:formylglycine-generating enzyme required for sulfatase activity
VAVLVGAVAALAIGSATWSAWPHVRFRWLFAPLGQNEKGLLEFRHRRTGIVMVLLPGGTFRMGSPADEEGRLSREGPVHEVTLSPFLMAKYEVREAEWERAMGKAMAKGAGGAGAGSAGAEPPVVNVSWDDSREFCRKTGLRLPSEAEWEYACRAGADGPYAGTGTLDDMGWYDANSGGAIHPVGRKGPNAFGLHDLHGNVFEWCEDSYDEGFYSRPEAMDRDPLCDSGSEFRVVRGGSWFYDAAVSRSAYRGSFDRGGRIHNLGFRPRFAPVP